MLKTYKCRLDSHSHREHTRANHTFSIKGKMIGQFKSSPCYSIAFQIFNSVPPEPDITSIFDRRWHLNPKSHNLKKKRLETALQYQNFAAPRLSELWDMHPLHVVDMPHRWESGDT
jgi:hypothetical protein